MPAKISRNDSCACGSGRKAKRCHPEYVGMRLDIAEWTAEMTFFIECQTGYVDPMSDAERKNWKQMGCPHAVCPHETLGAGSCGAPDCGV